MILAKISKKLVEIETEPAILHELPGRLRIGIKALKRLGKDQLPLANHIRDLLEEIPAFTQIKLNALSGSLLVVYDKDKSDTENVLIFVRDVIRFLIGYLNEFKSVSEDDLPVVLERLSAHIRDVTDENLKFSVKPIPRELWVA